MTFEQWFAGMLSQPGCGTYNQCRELFEQCWAAGVCSEIDMAPAVRRVRAASKYSADEIACLDVAGAIARNVECYEGDDLLSRIVPPLKPVIGELLALRSAVSQARLALDEELGDTDIAWKEDDSPVARALQILTAALDVEAFPDAVIDEIEDQLEGFPVSAGFAPRLDKPGFECYGDGRRCDKCGGPMVHYRLGGYRCQRGCV